MSERLIFEHLMLRAFGLSHRKEVRFADADFFDLESESAISTAMMAAFCNLLKEDDTNRIWLEDAIRRLEAQPKDMGYNLPGSVRIARKVSLEESFLEESLATLLPGRYSCCRVGVY